MNFATWSHRHLDRYGDIPVLVIDERVWTSVELHDHACRLANGLISLGVAPGDRVLLVLSNGRDALVASAATWMAGAVLVALHPEAPQSESDHIIAHCSPAAAISAVPLSLPSRVTVRTSGAADPGDSPLLDDLIARHAPLAEPVPRSPADPSQLTYTSGSTGVPKATIYTHGGMDAFLGEVARMSLANGDLQQVALVTLPLTVFGGFLLRSRWTARQKLVVVPRFDPREAHLAITRHGVTQLSLVPSIAEALLSVASSLPAPTTVREIRIGGAHTPPELARALESHFGARPLNTYGMTEAGGMIASDELGGKPGSVGQASPGVEIKIVDGEGRLVPTGHEGEVFVRTPWQAAGYWGATADAGVFQPGGWLRTGDRGRLDVDGALYLSGRSKDIIIQGGHNVVPIEVHDVVRAMPGVAECAIFGVPHPFLGEMVVAWVVRRPGAAITEDDVLAHCRTALDPRKWPGRVFFADALPMTAAGKVKLDELRQRTATNVDAEPEIVRQLRSLPADRRATVLRAEIARELAILVGAEPTDPYETFSNYGLTSLRAVQLANTLSRRLGRSVPVTLLFRHSTIDALARALLDTSSAPTRRRTPRSVRRDDDPIVVVGAACRLPGGVTSPEEFWELLRSGRDTVRDVPEGRWNLDDLYDPERPKPGKTYVRTASFLDHADEFDAAFFGMTAEAAEIDPQHRLLLETSWEALERAGYDPRAVPGLVGMMVGISSSSYPARNPLGVHRGMALGRVCHFLNLRGPAQSIDTTCSSSLVALHDAVRALQLGECDTALVGGVSVMWSPEPVVGLCQLELLAADGRSKAFDASGDGFGQGEGCIVLALERLSEARARGNRVLAIVRGTAINHDGHSSSLTAPNPEAQEEVIRTALAVANLEPDAVQYIEAHGTGTVLGDPIEVEAMTAAFGARRVPLAIGSVKSNVGHLEAAAGLVGALKVVLAMQHRHLPPSLHFKSPNPHIRWDSIPIRVQDELGPWPSPDAPLIAGVSSFGLSGTNAHVIFEEAPLEQPRSEVESNELLALPLSARTPDALRTAAERFAQALDDGAGPRRDIAYTAACRRHHFPHRLAVLGTSVEEWSTRLRAFARDEHVSGVVTGRAAHKAETRAVFAFTGQGAQWWGMGRELLATEAVFASAFDRCAELVERHVSWRLREELARDEATSRLAETEIAQPAIFALQVALCALWRSWGVEPAAVVGHSVGEIAAAHIAGALTLEDAARLAATRGRVMQTATGLGKMAWATLAIDDAEKVLAEIPGLELAASNGPRAITFSGPARAIEEAVRTLGARGVECKELRVNYAFHSAVLDEHARALTAELHDLPSRVPELPMISTLTGTPVEQLDAAYWGAEVRGRVRFYEAIRVLLADGYTHFVEVGAHPVLAPMIEAALEEAGREAFVTASLRRDRTDGSAMLEAVSAMHASGYPIDWTRQSPNGRVVDLPTYPWEHERYQIEDHVPLATSSRPSDPLDRLFHTVTWKERPRGRAAVRDARYLVVADAGGVAERLQSALEASGASVSVVRAGERLAAEPPTRIIYLAGIDRVDPGASTSIALLQLVQAIVDRGWDKTPRLFVVTRGAQAARGEAPGFAQSALWGVGAGLVHEHPELDVTLIDLDPNDLDTARLHDEIIHADREDRIALRGALRLVPRLVRSRAPASTWTAAPDRTYLVTGGLGALGLIVARRLVALGARHVVLVGRSAPSPDTLRVLDELRGAGARVQVAHADVADERALADVFAQVRSSMPPLAGVIHAAGVSDGGVLVNLDAQRVSDVMAPKVLGAWNLHRLTEDLSLDLFVVFSSIAGLLGVAGDVHYSAANAFLDGLAHYRRLRGLPAHAIDWGGWTDTGMVARMQKHPGLGGGRLLSVADGADAFARALADRNSAQTIVVELDAREWRQANPRAASMQLLAELVPSASVAGAGAIVERIRGATEAERTVLVENYVRGAISKVTGMSVEEIRLDLTLSGLALSSLMMISLRNVVLRELGVSIPLRQLFQTLTVAGLAGEIRSRFRDDTVSSTIDPTPPALAAALAIDVADGAALVRADRSGVLPLSYVQERQWFVQQLDPSRVFNLSRSVSITGPLQVDALEHALSAVIARHEPLRTTFAQVDGRSVYVIAPPRAVVLPVIDVTEHAGEDLHRLDVVEGPVLRVLLIRTSATEHVLTVVAHHAVFDAVSLGVFWKDLSDAYAALSRGQPWLPPALAIQSADVAAWERGWLTGDRLEAQLSYWTGRLAGLPQLDLPTDRPRPAVLGTVARNHVFTVPRRLVSELEAVSRRDGVTLFSTLLSAYATVLSRYADQRDFVVGIPVSMRDRPELVPLIGLFVNALPVRVELARTVTIRDLVHRTQQTLHEGLEHKEVPLAQLIERLRLRRDRSRYPLAQATMTVYTADAPQIAGLEVREIQGAAEGAEAEVALSFAQLDGGELRGSILYRSDLFEPATIATFAGYFVEVLEAFAHTGWEQPVESLPAAPAERPRPIAPATPRRIVVAATYTADPIAKPLALWFDKLQLHAAVELAPYNQIFQELLDPTSAVGQTDAQGVNVLLIRLEDWTGLSYEETVSALSARALASVEAKTGELIAALTAAAKRSPATFVVCVSPISKAARADPGFARQCAEAEERLVGAFSTTSNVRVVPSFETLADPSLDYDDAEANRLGHVPYTATYFATLGTLIARRLYRLVTPPKKVLVLDADQTLWRGVCGEDGPDGIVLDAPHVALQQFMLERSKAGMLLCLCSKNNEEDIAAVFARRPEMLLKREHLVAQRVNWQPKSMNLRSLAAELSLGLDSFILVDDDPAVCAEVEANCPEVLTLRIPTDETLPRFLDNVWAFDTAPSTAEDAKRTALYQQNSARARLQDSSSSFGDFLANLDLRVTLAPMGLDQRPRVAQLTTRTNQFNTTTIRRTERELEVSGLECITVEVSDKFGDYGLVGVVLFRAVADALVVDSMLLSCRALGRGVEHRMLARVGEIAQQRGLLRVDVRFAKSAKNAPALGFLDSTGAAYLVTGPGGDTYQYPTEIAAALVFTPGDVAPEVPRDEAKATPVRAPMAPWSDVARELYDAARVMEAMSAARSEDAFVRTEYVAPRTPLEATIAEIWSELLDGTRVGIHDDFFAVGGHSLLTVRVIARLRRELHVELSVSALFDAPTVAALAAMIAGSRTDGERAALPPLVAGPRDAHPPLSFAQERLWFLRQLEPDSRAYHTRDIRRIEHVDIAALRGAFEVLVARHEILRTSFPASDGVPYQRVHAPSPWALPIHDARALDEDAQHARIAARLRMLDEPFDLAAAPPVRAELVRVSDSAYVLLVVMHHIVTDGGSLRVQWGEVWAAYDAFAAGHEAPSLPPLSVQYADFAAWQRTWLAGDELANQLAFWTERLRGAPDETALPFKGPRPPVQTFGGRAINVVLPARLADQVRALARAHGATVFMTFSAALRALLARYTGQRDLVLGAPIDNRSHTELAGLIGMFVNTLALRGEVRDDDSFTSLLAREKAAALAAYAHQHTPFELIVDALGLERNLARTPLFQVVYQHQERGARDIGRGTSVDAVRDITEPFDLSVVTWDNGPAFEIYVVYNTDLFDHSMIEQLVRHFTRLLELVAGEPEHRLATLDLLDDAERRQLRAWNDTAQSVPLDASLHALVEEQVDRAPDAVAAVFDAEQLTYRELDQRANQLAHHLRSLGVGPEVCVGLCVRRSLDMVVAVLGILKAGGAYVPLDPSYPAERLAFMLDDTAAPIVVAHDALVARVARPGVRIVRIDADHVAIAEHPPHRVTPMTQPHHLAYVIYTSGSTGRPKGVMVEHRHVVNHALGWGGVERLGPTDRVLQMASLSFDGSVLEIFPAWLYGATLVLRGEDVPSASELFGPRFAGLTVAFFTTAYFHVLAGHDVPASLRFVSFGGERVRASDVRAWLERAPQCELHHVYGPTEATALTTGMRLRLADLPPGREAPIGRPLPNYRVHVLDANLRPVPVGVAGELYVGGASVARGYLHRAELTAQRFVSDPFGTPGEHLYRTGDLVRWLPDGTLDFLGRIDQQVKIRGFRVELGEIEHALCAHPAVSDAIVLVRTDLPGDPRLVAYVIGGVMVPADLHDHLRDTLPSYMVPSAIVVLDAFPLTPNGKVDRKALPAPDLTSSAGYVAPRTAMEILLARKWSELLGVEQVGVHDNFFELGGHSLLAVRMIERLRREGLALEVRTLFATPTLEAVAAVLTRAREREVPPNLIAPDATEITPAQLPLITLAQEDIDAIVARVPGGVANVQDIYALSPLQEGMLFHHQLAGEDDTYVLLTRTRFRDRALLDRYLAALQRVVDRHDVLRTAIVWKSLSTPAQVVWRRAPLPVREVTFAEAGALGRARLDLTRAPLLQLAIAPDPDGVRWHLIQQAHHMVVDHESMDLMAAEIDGILAGRTDAPPASPPYRNLVASARSGGNEEAVHARYFREQLADVDEPSAPFGIVDAHGDGRGVTEVYRALPPELDRRLRAQAQRLGVGPALLHHVAWAVVVGRTTGHTHAVFGTVLFGRMHVDGADHALGLYLNTLPIKLDARTLSVEAGVREAQAALAELMRHEHAPLALAQRCSGVASPAPLFTTLLNYRHMAPGAPAGGGDLGIEVYGGEERTNYALVVSVNDSGTQTALSIQAAQPLSPGRVGAMMERALEQIAHALEHAPQLPLHAIDIVDPAEHAQLTAWNATARAVPADTSLHALFEAQVDRAPDAAALTFAGASLTYRELDARVNQLAHHLLAAGAGQGRTIGVRLERSPAMVISVLAILKTGAAYVPIDPAYPEARVSAIREASGCRFVVDDAWLAAHPGGSSARPGISLDGHDAAYVLFTSGSTGTPKGAVIEHAGLRNRLLWPHAFGFTAADRFVLKTPFTFDVSVFELLYPFVVGGCLVIAAPDGHRDPQYLATLIRDERITYAHFVPSMLGPFLDAARTTPCPTLRRVICSGEALPAALVRDAIEVLGVELYNLYGPTEATVDVSWWRCDPASRIVPIGVAAPNTRLYVLDRDLRQVPIGVAGELYLAGVQLARGYAGRPDLTAERFMPDPFHPGERMYCTGDLARFLPDGAVEYLGRLDHQVKLRGLRIELGEIEAVLRTHVGVSDAAVIVRDDALVAYVVPRAAAIANDALQATLRAAVPEYMVPAVFVTLAALPLTSSGKLDRKALPAPDLEATTAYVAPRDDLEATLAQIWRETLRVERVGVHDDFFALGGHSLLAIRLLASIERRLGVRIPLREIFVASTLGGLAARVGQARTTTPSGEEIALVPTGRRRGRLLAPQRGSYLVERAALSVGQNRRVLSTWLDGPLDIAALERALHTLRERHVILRTRFFEEDGELWQEVLENPAATILERADVSTLAEEDREREDAALVDELLRRPFDFEQGALSRAVLTTWSPVQHRLTIALHHITWDPQSVALFEQELYTLWHAYVTDPASAATALPPPTASSIDLVDYLDRLGQTPAGERTRAYWRTTLEGATPIVIPSDLPREAVDTRRTAYDGFAPFPSATVGRLLGIEETADLKRIAQTANASLLSVLLASFCSELSVITGQDDLSIVGHLLLRHIPGLERSMGYFANPLILRVSTAGAPTTTELIARTHDSVTAAFEHGDFDVLREASHLFRVHVSYQYVDHRGDSRGEPALPPGVVRSPAPLRPSQQPEIPYDLILFISVGAVPDRIQLFLRYNTWLFREETVDAFLARFVERLRGAPLPRE